MMLTVPATVPCGTSFDLDQTVSSSAGAVAVPRRRVRLGTRSSTWSRPTCPSLTASALPESVNTAGPVTGRWAPAQPLVAFDGEQAAGTWTLRVSGMVNPDGGSLQQWGLLSGYDCATTAATAPVVATGDARDIGGTAATLGGTVDPSGTATSVAFEVGTTTAYGRRTPPVLAAGSGSGATAQSAPVDGLTPGTTYHYRVLGSRDGVVVVRGADRTFTTLSQSCVDARAAVVAARGALTLADAALTTADQRLAAAVAAETLAATQVTAAKAAVRKAKKALRRATLTRAAAATTLAGAEQTATTQCGPPT